MQEMGDNRSLFLSSDQASEKTGFRGIMPTQSSISVRGKAGMKGKR